MSSLPSLISSLCCSTSPMLNPQHAAPYDTPARTGIRRRFQSCIHLLHKTVSLHLESASSTDQNWADLAPGSKRRTWEAREQSIRSARIAPSYPARPKHSAPTQTLGSMGPWFKNPFRRNSVERRQQGSGSSIVWAVL